MTTYSLHYESPKSDPLMRVPYPHHIDEKGAVGRQDFWDGHPARVIGFSSTKRAGTITTYQPHPNDPDSLVGLYPVFADSDGTFSTGQDKIEKVTVTP